MKTNTTGTIAARALKCSVALPALLAASTAFAQSTLPADESVENSDDIVVTGTLVRGLVPGGTNVIGVTEEAVKATGATTVTQLLQTVPQMGWRVQRVIATPPVIYQPVSRSPVFSLAAD